MPGSFDYQCQFLYEQTVITVEIPKQINTKQLDIVVTPLYISVTAPDYATVIDFVHETQFDSPIVKLKKGTLHITVPNPNLQNAEYKTENEQELIKRRNESFYRYQKAQKEQREKQEYDKVREQREAADQQHEAKMKEIERLRAQKEHEIKIIKSDLDVNEGQSSQDQQYQNLPAVRSAQTVTLTANFTKRNIGIPARDGRDIYADASIGPVIPDVKKKSPIEQLEQAKSYAKSQTPDYESAIDILKNLLQQSPLYMDALIFLGQVLLKQSRCDDCLQFTAQMLRILQNKHDLQIQQKTTQNFSKQMHSQVNAMHAAALAGIGKYRDALKYLDIAHACNRENEELKQDLQLMQNIVAVLQ